MATPTQLNGGRPLESNVVLFSSVLVFSLLISRRYFRYWFSNKGEMPGTTEVGLHRPRTAEEMDTERNRSIAYQYLCHLREARQWLLSTVTDIKGGRCPPLPEEGALLEETLRTGVHLALVAHHVRPADLPLSKIYDLDHRRYNIAGLQFKHTENIHNFLKILEVTELPKLFYPETTDIYDRKNMPKLIYCLHALGTHLFKLGKAPLMHDLFGTAEFSDAEIDHMSKELQKSGVTMPSFQKIGGLLTPRSKESATNLHNIISKINTSIDSDGSILKFLIDRNANLTHVIPKFCDDYHKFLKVAKQKKVETTLNRSLSDSFEPDEYDELLTHSEIQGYINLVNFSQSWKNIIEAIYKDNEKELSAQLNAEWLNLKHVKPENLRFYMEDLKQLNPSSFTITMDNVIKWNNQLQDIIKTSNEKANNKILLLKTVETINQSLEDDDSRALTDSLLNFKKYTNLDIDQYSIPLIFEELKADKASCGVLKEEDIKSSIPVLMAIANISKQIDIGNNENVVKALVNSYLPFEDFKIEIADAYCKAFKSARQQKINANMNCSILTFMDIQECIDDTNLGEDQTQNLITVLENLNDAIRKEDSSRIMNILQDETLDLQNNLISSSDCHYLNALKIALKKNHYRDLWLDDVKKIIMDIHTETMEVNDISHCLVEINSALLHSNPEKLKKNVCSLKLTHSAKNVDAKLLFEHFKECFSQKSLNFSPWIVHHTTTGKTVYINIETLTTSWTTPKDFKPLSRYVSVKDINALMRKITALSTFDINKIVILQAHIRGYITRKRIKELRKYYQDNIESIIKIQAWWRMRLAKKRYLAILKDNAERVKRSKLRSKDPRMYYKSMEKSIVLIQALWRGRRARQAFVSLIKEKNPPFKVVKYFVPLLDFSTEDYEREIELQLHRSEVVQIIRKNLELSKQLESMDLKIGLLIQNRISLNEVVAHKIKLNDIMKRPSTAETDLEKDKNGTLGAKEIPNVCGLKLLNKESRHLLEGYQHLFYQLQTDPKYLSKLLFCLPQSCFNRFLQNVIFSLYNFGANKRDQYLLLKLFRFSLEEEINCKFNNPMDIITGNPVVLKMVVNHARSMDDMQCLKTMLGPLIEQVINNKNINIDTSPVDIYKTYRNQLETRTGQPSSLPISVDQEQALQYEEVRNRLNRSLKTLISMVSLFLEKITNSCYMLPFSIRYIARVLNYTIMKKFPNTPEKVILKIIGHLVYYQFINAAIVAPDAFEIVNSSHKNPLTNEQRRNLASIAKILQFSASKKGFGDEAKHLKALNPFIIECHEKMKNFFRQCCQGPTLEEYFHVDEYSEAILIYKPHIYISVEEIYNTHEILLQYEDIIAPDPADPLHDLLDAVSSPNSGEPIPLANLSPINNNEICLTLTNKYQMIADNMSDVSKLFLKTKEITILILPFLNGDHLLEALCIGTTKAQEEQYRGFVEQRLYSGSIKPNESMKLREQISLLRKYLQELENEGYVTREDGYQAIITAIARDLYNKRNYRNAQSKALVAIKKTKNELKNKTDYYEEQCRYYNEYINTCLENLSTGKRIHSVMMKKSHDKVKSKFTFKTTGLKLYEKGVLLEIQDLSVSQLKNVQFEFTPTEHNGVFVVKGKFFGVELEKVEIDVQQLLQAQYEGCSVINLFDRVKINVNLLLFLINAKFYGKS